MQCIVSAPAEADPVITLIVPPTITLNFDPATVIPGATSTLTATLSNPNSIALQLNSADVTITGLPGAATLVVPGSTPTIACSDGSGSSDPPIVIPAENGSTPGTCTLTFANVSAGATAGTYTATWPSDVQFVDNDNQTISVNTSTVSTATLTVASSGPGAGSTTATAPALSGHILLLLGLLLAEIGIFRRPLR